ncbi:MAG: heme exporter protein CcmD [Hyphomonadaceae bacterium]|nr:heme exporter protein CcmD [Hyphomonadaceae bacterium]
MIPVFDHTAPYIWAAYGLAAAVLIALVGAVLWRAHAARARLERVQKQAEKDDAA